MYCKAYIHRNINIKCRSETVNITNNTEFTGIVGFVCVICTAASQPAASFLCGRNSFRYTHCLVYACRLHSVP